MRAFDQSESAIIVFDGDSWALSLPSFDTSTYIKATNDIGLGFVANGTNRVKLGGAADGQFWIEALDFGRVDIRGSLPSLNFFDSDAPAGRKFKRVVSDDQRFAIEALDDSYGGARVLPWN